MVRSYSAAAVLGLAALVAGESVASATVYLYTGDVVRSDVTFNQNSQAGSFYKVGGATDPASVYLMPQQSETQVGWSGGTSGSGWASAEALWDSSRTYSFGAATSGSAQAYAAHGHLRAAASAAADVRPGNYFDSYNGTSYAVETPLSAQSVGDITTAYSDVITVFNPSLGPNDYVQLHGTLHLHAGMSMTGNPHTTALAETELTFGGTRVRLDGGFYFSESSISLARHFENGAWVRNDLQDVGFTIDVLNGTTFSIYQTLHTKAVAGALTDSDYALSDVNALNTATLALTPVEEGTQFSTTSGATYVVPEPGTVGLLGVAGGVLAARRRGRR